MVKRKIQFCIGTSFCTKSFSSEEEVEDVDDTFDNDDDDTFDDDDDESYHPSGDESSLDENSVDDLGKLEINVKHVTRFLSVL